MPSAHLRSIAFAALSAAVIPISTLAQDAQQPTVRWVQLAGREATDIAAANLNGDSKPDFAIGGGDQAILAVTSDGSVLWRFAVHGSVRHLAVGDLDGDGIDDVVGTDDSLPAHLHAVSGSGEELWTQTIAPGLDVKIGDVTGDPRSEIVLLSVNSNFDRTVSVYDDHGLLIFSQTVPLRLQSVGLGDMIGDAHREIALSYGEPFGLSPCPCGVEVITGSGTILWNFAAPNPLVEMALADLNGDGQTDIVTAEYGPPARYVYALDSSGTLIWQFALRAGVFGNGASAIGTGDIDGDLRPDVVVGSLDQHAYALRSDGQLLWDTAIGANIFEIAFGDLDGDGADDIAVATMVGARAGVYALSRAGTQFWFFPKTGSDVECPDGECVQGFPDLVVEDVNADGRAEVVAIQNDLGPVPDQGLVFALSTPPVLALPVTIDIKPGHDPNSINTRSRGKIAVAILSSPMFDVLAQLDTGSLTFGHTGDEASLAFCHPGHANGDALEDLICHFATQSTGLLAGDRQAVLKGKTVTGTAIVGSDSVRIVR
jgi:outer membrane protein assembly factor BamB